MLLRPWRRHLTYRRPCGKPDPNAPSAAPEEPIINLLDREPEPLFSDTLVPYAPARASSPGIKGGLRQGALYLMAKLTPDSPPLNEGLIWRIYSETTNADGRLQLVATSQGGDAEFRLDPGTYLIHTAYGFSQATNRIVIGKEVQSKMVTLNAGGIKFGAALKDGEDLDGRAVAFDLYGMEFNQRGERNLIASNVKPGSILRLSANTYHVVSKYGDVNAVVRADIQVLPGKLTEATIFHKAAGITLKLVNERGGEAIANTTWSVLSPGGTSWSRRQAPSLISCWQKASMKPSPATMAAPTCTRSRWNRVKTGKLKWSLPSANWPASSSPASTTDLRRVPGDFKI